MGFRGCVWFRIGAMESEQIEALKAVVQKLQEDPTLCYQPDMVFFKEFLLSWNAKIPQASFKPKKIPTPTEEEKKEEKKKEDEEEEEEEEEEEVEVELEAEDDPDRLQQDPEPFPAKGPPGETEFSDEQWDKQGELKQSAVEALEDGDLEKATELYTQAITMGNPTAMMYAKRAEFLMKLKRPCACISDCNAAIDINPDSGKAFRIRGKAHRCLGKWEEAHSDLSKAQMLDYDDGVLDVVAYVNERWKKISEKKTQQRLRSERIAKKKREQEKKKAREEAQKRYEEQKKAEEGFPGGFPGSFPGGMGGIGGGMGGMGMPAGMDPAMLQALMSDPELMQALSNPKFLTAMQD